ncbi:MAG: LysR family transcriptional regulator [Pseudomonadota bacterium]
MNQRMDIDALQALCAIEECGGVTRAAKRLSLTQSAVSHKVRRLESRIGRKLLARRAGGPVFTEDGTTLIAYARRILSLHDEAVRSLATRPLAGTIRLGMTEDTSSSGLARILARFRRLHPDVNVHTQVDQSKVLQSQLENGEIDVAVMQTFEHDVQRSDIILYQDSLHWVKSKDAQFDFDSAIPFLAFDKNCFYKHWVDEVVDQLGVRFETVLQCASNAGIVTAVEVGMGVAVLNARHISQHMHVIDDNFPLQPPGITYVVRVGEKSRTHVCCALADEIDQENDNVMQIAISA